ncbi:MAG: hypothetical protein ACJAXA_003546 [Candidatus Aldehydirespiratoraceae bacterium]|jgi:hypothetical protein
MTLAIFGVGIFVFFITVYAVVVAGGLQLSAYQLRDEPDLAADSGFSKKRVDGETPGSDGTSAEA